ncbi:hypothetical protein BD309DRAFT_969552 [Dichomitus squalens]|uniref:Uncharacterized protein n=1 Tax=Dichomitus squalens TaxID=114155 RepID=A0A4Q9PR33_9APHY|nr:hypothetical protein BD309DRAFT_969552 [Dichomitus squalens]TBU56735.1 hypothetical protein BD310DRAFT_930963 [Dichomitus squalens]
MPDNRDSQSARHRGDDATDSMPVVNLRIVSKLYATLTIPYRFMIPGMILGRILWRQNGGQQNRDSGGQKPTLQRSFRESAQFCLR